MRTAFYSLISGAAGALVAGVAVSVAAPNSDDVRSPDTILRSYVEDFCRDRAAETPRTIGVRVDGEGGGMWTIEISGERSSDDHWEVDLRPGEPEVATFIYTVDTETLAAIDAGRLNALTAQGKAWTDDITPMAIEWMPGAEPRDVNAFSFHFWTRGFPEKVPFGRGMTRTVHSANMSIFYYQPGFRSAYCLLDKGEGANNGPGQPLMAPFPTMVITIAGRAHGMVDGEPAEAAAGEMVFIPPMTPHEWWNEGDEPAETILVFFGEGA